MEDIIPSTPTKLKEIIKRALHKDNPIEALNLLNDEKYRKIIQEFSWAVIDVIIPHLTIDNLEGNPSLFKVCEDIIHLLAKKCKPSEIILELLEQMDTQTDDIRFCTLLKPLKVALLRLNDKSKVLDWCINTIKAYIEDIPSPASNQDSEETKSLSLRIIKLYEELISFLKPLIEEASIRKKSSNEIKNLLLSLLLSLLGKPLCYVPSGFSLSESVSEIIAHAICKLAGDGLLFLTIVIERERMSQKLRKGTSNILESVSHVSDLAYTNFYYLLYTKQSLQSGIPQIYNPHYIFHNCLHLSCIFLRNKELFLVSKGLNFIELIISRMEKDCFEKQTLSEPAHSQFLPEITEIMIYCESEEYRKQALKIFRNYLNLFTLEAKYQIILQLYKITNHSGIMSLLIGVFKDSIMKCLEENPPLPYFLGSNLKTFLFLSCKLSHGAETDLIEIAEEIIASLNLIRFLAIRDMENVSGFWDYIKELDETYLKCLRQGINLSLGHWKWKLKFLESEEKKGKKNLQEEKDREEVTVIVGSENLKMLPISEKIKFARQALNALDIMESVLIRVNECLEVNRLRSRIEK